MQQTTYNCVKIGITIGQISGLVPFQITQTGTQKSNYKKLLNYLILFTNYSTTIYILIAHLSELSTGAFSILIILWMLHSLLHVSMVIILSLKNESLHRRLLHDLVDLDRKMIRNGFRLNNQQMIRKMKWISILTLPMFLFCFLYRMCGEISGYTRNSIVVLIFALLFIPPIFIHYFTIILFINYILYIRTRFRTLNHALEKLTVSEKRIATIERKDIHLTQICTLHHDLTKIMEMFNEVFGLTMLSVVSHYFNTIISGVYFILSVNTSDQYERARGSAGWVTLFIYCAITLCHFCETVEEEVLI